MHTSQHVRAAVLAAAAALLAGAAAAAGTPVIYPAKEQSARQQDQDKYACHDWARNESGFDPTAQSAPLHELAAAASSADKPAPTATDKLAGAVTGAAGGAAIAELAHRDAGRGAAMGLLGSNVLARVKGKSGEPSAQQQQQRAQQQAALREHARQQRAGYDRAFAACLEGRGYVVK